MRKALTLPLNARVVLYARISNGDTATAGSIDSQLTECDRYAGTQGWVVVGDYSDDETGTTTRRNGLNNLMDAARKRAFDVVLCTTMDRLGRGLPSAFIEQELAQHRIAVRYVYQDFTGDNAEAYLRREAQRFADGLQPAVSRDATIRVMKEHFLAGYFVGGQIPFGYTSVPDPAGKLSRQNRVLRRRVVDGNPNDSKSAPSAVIRAITAVANGLGVPEARAILAAAGGPASYTGARDLILNGGIYAGRLQWNGLTRTALDLAIVGAELLQKAQEAIEQEQPETEKRERRTTSKRMPLVGRIYCACGARMTTYWAKGNGGQYDYYRCGHETCTARPRQVNASRVHDAILAELSAIATTPWRARHAASWMAKEKASLPELVKGVREAEKKAAAALTRARNYAGTIGLVESEATRRRLLMNMELAVREEAEAKEEAEQLREQMKQHAGVYSAAQLQMLLANFSTLLSVATDDERKKLLDLACGAVRIKPEGVNGQQQALIVELRADLLGEVDLLRERPQEVRIESKLKGG